MNDNHAPSKVRVLETPKTRTQEDVWETLKWATEMALNGELQGVGIFVVQHNRKVKCAFNDCPDAHLMAAGATYLQRDILDALETFVEETDTGEEN